MTTTVNRIAAMIPVLLFGVEGTHRQLMLRHLIRKAEKHGSDGDGGLCLNMLTYCFLRRPHPMKQIVGR